MASTGDRARAARRASETALFALLLVAGCGKGSDAPATGARRGPPPAPVNLPPRTTPSPVRFVDVTAESGVAFVHDNGFDHQGYFYVETLGSGLIAFDADGDGDVDLFFCNGHRLSGAPAAESPRCAFYRNDGHGHFTDATDESGLGDRRYAQGVTGADYDNDGDLDLYVTMYDEANALYRNDGHGRFTDVAAAAGASGRNDGIDGACAFADVDGDGLVDLYVGGCVDATRQNNKPCWDTPDHDEATKLRRYCHPVDFRAQPDLLLRNRGDGTFEDVTGRAGLGELLGRTLGVAFFDLDDDGDQDLFVACDRGANFLLMNDGKGRFTENGRDAGVALSDGGAPQAGMGVTTGDYDGDGRLDLGVTYFEREPAGLYRNLGGGQFESRSAASGAGAATWSRLKWGTEFFDADLDGQLDWIIANGHIEPELAKFRKPLVGYAQPLAFLLNRGGGLFEELGAEAGECIAVPHSGRGLVVADLDGDGDLDVVLNNSREAATVLRNDSPRADHHWLEVKTVGTKSNRDGIGARVTITTGANLGAGARRQIREVRTAQSYYSQSDLRLHFGLAGAAVVDELLVRWPSGRQSRLTAVAADQVVTVTEPAE